MTAEELKKEIAGARLQGSTHLVTPGGFELLSSDSNPGEAYLFVGPDGDFFEVPMILNVRDEENPDSGADWHITLDLPPAEETTDWSAPGYTFEQFFTDLVRRFVELDDARGPESAKSTITFHPS